MNKLFKTNQEEYRKFEFKTGSRGNPNKIHSALKIINYIENLPLNKMFGIIKVSKEIIILTKEEVIFKKEIDDMIQAYEKLINDISESEQYCHEIPLYKHDIQVLQQVKENIMKKIRNEKFKR